MTRLIRQMLSPLALILTLATPALPQAVPPPETFTINLRDADLRTLAEQVSAITGRTMVLDPNVSGTVTVIASQPLDKDGVWELFQSVLAVQGFAALPSGGLWRIVPQEAIKEGGGIIGAVTDGAAAEGEAPGRLDVITRLVTLRNFPAETAVAALRPLVASFGYIEAVADTNTLVITDTAENVRRIETIALTLDQGKGAETRSVRLQHGSAPEVGAAINEVLGPAEANGGAHVTVNASANLLLITADAETQGMIGDLIAAMDVPGRSVASVDPVTRVYRLNYADATAMTEVLRGLVGDGGAVATNPVALATQDGSGLVDLRSVPQGEGGEQISIQASVETNAVVVRARQEVQNDIAALIRDLDQRRPQVLIEAAIVEVSGDISEALGVQLGIGEATPPGGFAATSFSPAGVNLKNVLTLLGVPAAGAINAAGLSIGLSRNDDFGILIQALGQSTKANLLSTPSITTLDNQPAEIIVGQNVPFRTGSFATDGNTTTPFTTIERKDVGITMRVVPRVNQGDVVQLEISQEVSSLLNTTVEGAADLITNRRSIKTTVLADNGGTIVLGGLITDDRQLVRSEVPGLGRLPVFGGLFRSKNDIRRKQTLFVFLRPTILRTRADVATVSGDRFRRLEAIDANPGAALPPLGSAGSKSFLAGPGDAATPRPVKRAPVEIEGVY